MGFRSISRKFSHTKKKLVGEKNGAKCITALQQCHYFLSMRLNVHCLKCRVLKDSFGETHVQAPAVLKVASETNLSHPRGVSSVLAVTSKTKKQAARGTTQL